MPSLADQRRGTWHAALVVHALGQAGPDRPVAYVTRWIESPHGCVIVRHDLPWCPDCPARAGDAWVTAMPPGYSFAVVIEHADSCPWLSGHLHAQEGEQP